MKRRSLLIAACFFGALSVGLNIYLYSLKKEPPAVAPSSKAEVTPDAPAGGAPVREAKASPAPPFSANFDFSDTAFADDSWKLKEPKSAISLDKPFDWEDVNPAKPKVDDKSPDPKDSYAGTPAKIDPAAQPPPPAPPK
jgi:hypothetical protein